MSNYTRIMIRQVQLLVVIVMMDTKGKIIDKSISSKSHNIRSLAEVARLNYSKLKLPLELKLMLETAILT